VITVVVTVGGRGNLVSAAASGHAGKGCRGEDIVCAAVTILLRTTMAVLAGSGESDDSVGTGSELVIEAETAGRGSLAFRVTAYTEGNLPFLIYAAAFLREGLRSLEREYPEAVAMRVESAIC
jgi:uncharacterized protein YsxB (DUF464 family)